MTKGIEISFDETNDYGGLALFAWIAFAVLVGNTAYFVGTETGAAWFRSEDDLRGIMYGFGIGLIKAMPTMVIAFTVADFALLFGRCSKGDVFTERNVSTLRSSGDSLLFAAIASAFLVPLLLGAVDAEGSSNIGRFTDLSLGVALMGALLRGLSSVYRDALAIKTENDEIL